MRRRTTTFAEPGSSTAPRAACGQDLSLRSALSYFGTMADYRRSTEYRKVPVLLDRMADDEPAAGTGFLSELSGAQRRVFLQHMCVQILWECQWGLSGASNASKLMELVGGNMISYQNISTIGWTVNNMLNLFLAPITAALSDTFGRIPFMAQGRLAIMGLFIGHRYCTNVRVRARPSAATHRARSSVRQQ